MTRTPKERLFDDDPLLVLRELLTTAATSALPPRSYRPDAISTSSKLGDKSFPFGTSDATSHFNDDCIPLTVPDSDGATLMKKAFLSRARINDSGVCRLSWRSSMLARWDQFVANLFTYTIQYDGTADCFLIVATAKRPFNFLFF